MLNFTELGYLFIPPLADDEDIPELCLADGQHVGRKSKVSANKAEVVNLESEEESSQPNKRQKTTTSVSVKTEPDSKLTRNSKRK